MSQSFRVFIAGVFLFVVGSVALFIPRGQIDRTFEVSSCALLGPATDDFSCGERTAQITKKFDIWGFPLYTIEREADTKGYIGAFNGKTSYDYKIIPAAINLGLSLLVTIFLFVLLNRLSRK